MACESLKGKLDTYLDGELPEQEMRTLDSHVRSCASCSSDALGKLQMKRAIQVAGKRSTPSAEFRKRIEQTVASKPRRSYGFGNLRPSWILAVAAVALVAFALFIARNASDRSAGQHAFSEIADLHVGTLASAPARRRDLHRSTHRETMVSGKDSLLFQSARSAEHRILAVGRPPSLS